MSNQVWEVEMLVACDRSGKVLTLLDGIPDKQPFFCPACKSEVRLRVGEVMRPHFAHVSLKNCDFYSENESNEHLSLKAELYRALSRQGQAEVEHVLADISQIADVWLEPKLALEVQCSRLSEKRMIERTRAYQQSGIQVLWLLGRKLWLGQQLSSLQKQFLKFSKNMGFYLWEVDSEERLLRLKYLIYQDLKGKVYYLSKTCSFDDDILAFLRLPYRAQTVSSYQIKQDRKIKEYIQKQLYQRSTYWLKEQEQAYLAGKNLLSQPLSDFFPQVRPIRSASSLCQIREDLTWFNDAFTRYYQKQDVQNVQKLYPPAFYGKIKMD